MKILWYIFGLVTLLIILINNPKSNSFGSIGDQSQFINYTRSTQKNMQILTIFIVISFLLSTIFLASNFFK